MKIKTDCELVFFVNSSGHCTFDCSYCIITPIAKKQPSIDYDDIKFLLDSFGNRKALLAFSGVGDFFAGYPKTARFLDRILDHDIEVALDVNGIIIQEFPTLPAEKLQKIRYINLTMHFHEIKVRSAFGTWAANARSLITARFAETNPDYIISPPYRDEWEEGIAFYDREIFAQTGKPLLLVRDVNRPLSDDEEQHLQELGRRFAHCVAGLHQEDFASPFADRPEVLCPAGRRYFRIWNDGRVQGCPNLPGVESLWDNGNLKERRLRINDSSFRCSMARFCDCNIIEDVGLMGSVEQAPAASS